jgi:hypothetical protein
MPEFVGKVQDQIRVRIDSVTKTAMDDFRSVGPVQGAINLATRFHQNNWALIGR